MIADARHRPLELHPPTFLTVIGVTPFGNHRGEHDVASAVFFEYGGLLFEEISPPFCARDCIAPPTSPVTIHVLSSHDISGLKNPRPLAVACLGCILGRGLLEPNGPRAVKVVMVGIEGSLYKVDRKAG